MTLAGNQTRKALRRLAAEALTQCVTGPAG